MTIWAIDPGPHTGIFWGDDDGHDSVTLDLDKAPAQVGMSPHKYLWYWLTDHVRKPDIIVCEKFEYQKEKAQEREALNYDAGEYVGVVKVWCAFRDIHIHMQSPSQVVSKDDKTFWNNDKLKSVGLWKGMSRHERDAARHYLYYVTFTLHNQEWLHKLK